MRSQIPAIKTIKKKSFGVLIVIFFLAITGCQELGIEWPEDSQLAFYNASHQLHTQIQNGGGSAPILVDRSEAGEITGSDPRFTAFFRELYPPSINSDDLLPWAEFMRVSPGNHTIRFLGTDSTSVLVETQIETLPNERSRLFLSDSLGTYHTLYLQDQGRAEARQARLRVAHLGPDVGELQLVINNEAVSLPQSLRYRTATDLMSWEIPEGKADTLLRVQVKSPDEEGEVLGRINPRLLPGETAYIVIYGYYNNASYEDAVTGDTLTIPPNFRMRAFKYN